MNEKITFCFLRSKDFYAWADSTALSVGFYCSSSRLPKIWIGTMNQEKEKKKIILNMISMIRR